MHDNYQMAAMHMVRSPGLRDRARCFLAMREESPGAACTTPSFLLCERVREELDLVGHRPCARDPHLTSISGSGAPLCAPAGCAAYIYDRTWT